jgi:hypothetical protein
MLRLLNKHYLKTLLVVYTIAGLHRCERTRMTCVVWATCLLLLCRCSLSCAALTRQMTHL